MIKRIFISFFVVTLFLPIFPSQAKSPNLYKGKIVIGYAIWPGYLGLYVAQDKGFFKKAGLDVEVRGYASLGELSRDYVAGKIQGRANLNVDAVKERQAGMDHKIILTIDYSNGSDTILATPDIASIAQIRGKRVAYEKGTMEEFFLEWMLSENEMRFSDIVSVDADPEKASQLLVQGETDVAVTYEPYASKAVAAGHRLIYSSKDAPGLITDVLTFRSDFIEGHPETMQAIVNTYFEALAFCKKHPDEAHAVLAKRLDTSPAEAAQQLEGLHILDERENGSSFTFSTGINSLYGNLRQISKFMRKRAPENRLNTDPIVEPRFVNEINDQL